ncbi:hypothetical protein PCANC_17400 [Puccinia coronata f. sp. avenae]|uniref:Uncharacterized protein n=1 Tax=Puccinia coronata f. sp. avenae TaxID=200324 RepID=A0A2N5SCD2_9BASI|nr:hypothetical protein PCANC_17400 [Puccinia coronata f. sp. avenae]
MRHFFSTYAPSAKLGWEDSPLGLTAPPPGARRCARASHPRPRRAPFLKKPEGRAPPQKVLPGRGYPVGGANLTGESPAPGGAHFPKSGAVNPTLPGFSYNSILFLYSLTSHLTVVFLITCGSHISRLELGQRHSPNMNDSSSSSKAALPSGSSLASLTNSTHQNLTQRNPPGWVHFVAGGLGGMSGAIVTAPFDLVKTRLQSSTYHADRSQLSQSIPSFSSSSKSTRTTGASNRLFYHFIDTGRILRDIHRLEGFRALFRGLGPTLVGAIPARAINFYVYGMGKEFYCKLITPTAGNSSTLVHICSAITAGIATSTATNPIWVVKTRLQLDIPSSSFSNPHSRSTIHTGALAIDLPARPSISTPVLPKLPTYSNFSNRLLNPLGNSLQCISKIYQQEGIPGFYRGLSASYLGVTEGTIQWTLYEKFKRWGSHFISDSDTRQEGTWSTKMVAAGAAKLIATGITYPHEVVRTRMRQKPPPLPAKSKYIGLISTFRIILAEEGPRAFYGGLSPHLLRVVPNAAVMYTVYEAALSISRSSFPHD